MHNKRHKNGDIYHTVHRETETKLNAAVSEFVAHVLEQTVRYPVSHGVYHEGEVLFRDLLDLKEFDEAARNIVESIWYAQT